MRPEDLLFTLIVYFTELPRQLAFDSSAISRFNWYDLSVHATLGITNSFFTVRTIEDLFRFTGASTKALISATLICTTTIGTPAAVIAQILFLIFEYRILFPVLKHGVPQT